MPGHDTPPHDAAGPCLRGHPRLPPSIPSPGSKQGVDGRDKPGHDSEQAAEQNGIAIVTLTDGKEFLDRPEARIQHAAQLRGPVPAIMPRKAARHIAPPAMPEHARRRTDSRIGSAASVPRTVSR